MSEESARIYDRARRSGVSGDEAWDDLEDLAKEVDWDVKRMLSGTDVGPDSTSDKEVSQ